MDLGNFELFEAELLDPFCLIIMKQFDKVYFDQATAEF